MYCTFDMADCHCNACAGAVWMAGDDRPGLAGAHIPLGSLSEYARFARSGAYREERGVQSFIYTRYAYYVSNESFLEIRCTTNM